MFAVSLPTWFCLTVDYQTLNNRAIIVLCYNELPISLQEAELRYTTWIMLNFKWYINYKQMILARVVCRKSESEVGIQTEMNFEIIHFDLKIWSIAVHIIYNVSGVQYGVRFNHYFENDFIRIAVRTYMKLQTFLIACVCVLQAFLNFVSWVKSITFLPVRQENIDHGRKECLKKSLFKLFPLPYSLVELYLSLSHCKVENTHIIFVRNETSSLSVVNWITIYKDFRIYFNNNTITFSLTFSLSSK